MSLNSRKRLKKTLAENSISKIVTYSLHMHSASTKKKCGYIWFYVTVLELHSATGILWEKQTRTLLKKRKLCRLHLQLHQVSLAGLCLHGYKACSWNQRSTRRKDAFVARATLRPMRHLTCRSIENRERIGKVRELCVRPKDLPYESVEGGKLYPARQIKPSSFNLPTIPIF